MLLRLLHVLSIRTEQSLWIFAWGNMPMQMPD